MGTLILNSNLFFGQRQHIPFHQNIHRPCHWMAWAVPERTSYPSPVESSSQVVPSPQRKDSNRRLRAQLQFIQNRKDPAHLQTYRGPEEREERQVSDEEDSLRGGGFKEQNRTVLSFFKTHMLLVQWPGSRKATYLGFKMASLLLGKGPLCTIM